MDFEIEGDYPKFGNNDPRVVDAAERVHVAPPKGDSKIRQTQVDYKVALPGGTRHLKIVWSRQMALDRVEIECGP